MSKIPRKDWGRAPSSSTLQPAARWSYQPQISGKTHPNICFWGSRIAKKFYVINESINISEENDINVIKCPKVFQVQRLLITASPPSDRISYAPAVWVTRCDGKWKVDPENVANEEENVGLHLSLSIYLSARPNLFISLSLSPCPSPSDQDLEAHNALTYG